jgi:hypothetical protein
VTSRLKKKGRKRKGSGKRKSREKERRREGEKEGNKYLSLRVTKSSIESHSATFELSLRRIIQTLSSRSGFEN